MVIWTWDDIQVQIHVMAIIIFSLDIPEFDVSNYRRIEEIKFDDGVYRYHSEASSPMFLEYPTTPSMDIFR